MSTDWQSIRCSIAFAVMTAAVVFGTGLFSDDFPQIVSLVALSGSVLPSLFDLTFGGQADFPVGYWTFALPYHYFGNEWTIGYEILKALYAGVSVWMVARFMNGYVDEFRAGLIAFTFVLLPNHDATAYFFLGQYLMLSIAGYCYADFQIRRGKYMVGALFAFLSSFICYGSTPVALSLGLLAILEGRYKHVKYLVVPNAVYVLYYLVVTQYFHLGHERIPAQLSWQAITQSYVLQVVTLLDAAIGPSFWLKIALSISEISLRSMGIAALGIFGIGALWIPTEKVPNRKLLGALGAMTVSALVMFAVTGRYPQIAFGLGDRVSIYGALLVSYWGVTAVKSHTAVVALSAIVVLAAMGISDHWRAWSASQATVMHHITNNKALQLVPLGETVWVTGNQYSRLRGISHIEFLSEDFVVWSVFELAMRDQGLSYTVRALNRRHSVEGNFLVDRKYKTRTELPSVVWVYDSEGDQLERVKLSELGVRIASLPVERRHWVMFLPDAWLRRAVIPLMPRLEYAL
mgnify:CR=1 FL=1